MTTNQSTAEYEELVIDTKDGIEVFWKNIHDLYREGQELESELLERSDTGEQTESTIEAFRAAYSKVRSAVGDIRGKIEKGAVIGGDTASDLQAAYDAFLSTREALVEIVDAPPQVRPEPEPAPQESKAESTPRKIEVTEEKEETKAAATQPAVETVDRPTKKKKRRKKKKPRPVLQVEASQNPAVAAEIKKAAERIQSTATRLKQREDVFVKTHPNPSPTEELLLSEIHESVERAELLRDKAKQLLNDDRPINSIWSTMEIYLQANNEIEAAASDIEKTLAENKLKPDPIMYNVSTSGSEMKVETMDRPEDAVEIRVQAKAEEEINTPKIKPNFSPQTIKDRSVKQKKEIPAQFSPKMAVRHNHEKRKSHQFTVPDPVHERVMLTKKHALRVPRYAAYLRGNYSSPQAFEKIVDSAITRIEAQTKDPIEQWLGEEKASAFSFLQDMTLVEVNNFNAQSYEDIKRSLQRENIKYETYLLWIDLLPEMLEVVPGKNDMYFGELYIFWLIELHMFDEENK